MRKHAILVRWMRINRAVHPVLDAHAMCEWPLGPEDNDVLSARALSAMIDGYDNLPIDVRRFCHAYWAMHLRLRYSNGDTTGPYIINDVEGTLDQDGIENWLATVSDAELARYHHAAHRVTRRINARDGR